MPTQKFAGDPGGAAHGGSLYWPQSPSGFPVRSETRPLLTPDEAASLTPVFDFHSATFQLWRAEDKARFDDIMDRIVNGWYQQYRRIDREVAGQIAPAVWLEWLQIYNEVPGAKSPHAAKPVRGPANASDQKPVPPFASLLD